MGHAALVPALAVKNLPWAEYSDDEDEVVQATRRLTMGWTARVRSRVSEGWRFSSLLRVQTGPGFYSASYKMSTGSFLRGQRRPSGF